ncbi:MAG: Tim44 domain-containing protein [Desulfobulbus sp.]|nr:Tim44 domain-containing protein [Desulfobulbus sp.]
MLALLKKCSTLFLVLMVLTFVDMGMTTDHADARSRAGGRSFSTPYRQPTSPSIPKSTQGGFNKQRQQTPQQQQPAGGFGRGLMGGLLGGALGGLLFGSLFGAGGSGMGILPLLLLGGVGYFLYKRFVNRPRVPTSADYQAPPFETNQFQSGLGNLGKQTSAGQPTPPLHSVNPVEQGLAAIRRTDPGFDDKYFLEVASDVFFKVQAGWMRRDLATFRHLLGDQLAEEYAGHFSQMREQGQINKLESIAIRNVEIVAADSTAGEDFVTVLFTANLLDYTIDEQTGTVLEGSMTEPVKFAEEWTWARPIRTENWKLERIEVVSG